MKPIINTDEIPLWLQKLALKSTSKSDIFDKILNKTLQIKPSEKPRDAGVLVGFSPGFNDESDSSIPNDAKIILIKRSSKLNKHAGQISFPGGAVEVNDKDIIETALRETYEEVGLNTDEITVFGLGNQIYVPPSNFNVVPVYGFWKGDRVLEAIDQNETESVLEVKIQQLIDPNNRFMVKHGFYRSPAFIVGDSVIWGFTGKVIHDVLERADWSLNWDRKNVRNIEDILGVDI